MLKKEEVDILIKELTRINKKYIGKNIVFIDYCRRKMEDRKIEENLVVKTLTGVISLIMPKSRLFYLKSRKKQDIS